MRSSCIVLMLLCGREEKRTPFTCADSQPPLAELQLPAKWDSMETRALEKTDDVTVSGRSGVACGSAKNAPACLARLDTAMPTNGFMASRPPSWRKYFFAATREDTVELIDDAPKLVRFLGAIDTPQEALLVAFANGYRVTCDDASQSFALRDGARWEVQASHGERCRTGIFRDSLLITANGTVKPPSSKLISKPANCQAVISPSWAPCGRDAPWA